MFGSHFFHHLLPVAAKCAIADAQMISYSLDGSMMPGMGLVLT